MTHAETLAANLRADFDKSAGDWELTEDKDGYERRILIFSEDRGWKLGEAVIDTAKEYGFDAGDYTSAEDEYYNETWDEAKEYLNALAPEGFYFYQDGDFFAVERRDFPEDTGCEPMPSHWVSYLINGDSSGLKDGPARYGCEDETPIADAYLKANNIVEVLDAPGEGYFSWSFDLYGGTAQGGDLLDYVVRYGKEESNA
jgi:hypothetical protein